MLPKELVSHPCFLDWKKGMGWDISSYRMLQITTGSLLSFLFNVVERELAMWKGMDIWVYMRGTAEAQF